MSNNALTIFGGSNIPDHIRKMQAEMAGGGAGDIQPRVSVPTLGVTGKVWTISADGQKVKMVSRNDEGDEIPASVMRVFILGYNKWRGRAYYEGTYDPENEAMPLCRSRDGKTPDEDVDEKQSAACQTCKWSAKGSRIDDRGKATVACSQHRILVVASPKTMIPLRLKIPVTSDYDKQGVHHQKQNWYAFQQYTDFLYANGVRNVGLVLTKMKFDPDAAYPKILFSPDSFPDEATAARVLAAQTGPKVKAMLSGTLLDATDDAEGAEGAEGVDDATEGVDENDAGEAPDNDADESDEPAPKPAATPAKRTPQPNVTASSPKATPKATPKPAAAQAPVEPSEATGVDDILNEWA